MRGEGRGAGLHLFGFYCIFVFEGGFTFIPPRAPPPPACASMLLDMNIVFNFLFSMTKKQRENVKSRWCSFVTLWRSTLCRKRSFLFKKSFWKASNNLSSKTSRKSCWTRDTIEPWEKSFSVFVTTKKRSINFFLKNLFRSRTLWKNF